MAHITFKNLSLRRSQPADSVLQICSSKTEGMRDFKITFVECNTVEPLIKDTPYKGHNRIYLHSKRDTFCGPKCLFLHTYNAFVTSKKWTTSLKRTKYLVPMCPLFGGSTVVINTRRVIWCKNWHETAEIACIYALLRTHITMLHTN